MYGVLPIILHGAPLLDFPLGEIPCPELMYVLERRAHLSSQDTPYVSAAGFYGRCVWRRWGEGGGLLYAGYILYLLQPKALS